MTKTIYKGNCSEQQKVEFNFLNSGFLAFTGLAFPIALISLFSGLYDIKTDHHTIRERREGERERYIADLKEGAEIIKSHLQNVPREEYPAVKEIRITPRSEERFLGTFVKEKPLEVEIDV